MQSEGMRHEMEASTGGGQVRKKSEEKTQAIGGSHCDLSLRSKGRMRRNILSSSFRAPGLCRLDYPLPLGYHDSVCS